MSVRGPEASARKDPGVGSRIYHQPHADRRRRPAWKHACPAPTVVRDEPNNEPIMSDLNPVPAAEAAWLEADPPERDSLHYLRQLRRRWWLVLLPVVVALLAAVAYVKTATPVYQAQSTLLLSPVPSSAALPISIPGLIPESRIRRGMLKRRPTSSPRCAWQRRPSASWEQISPDWASEPHQRATGCQQQRAGHHRASSDGRGIGTPGQRVRPSGHHDADGDVPRGHR